MVIDKETYLLDENNYIPIQCIKKQIVIGNTFNNGMKHYIGWKQRNNGLYKKTAPFTIDKNGNIYQHFEPSYQSKYFDTLEHDTKSIVILMENVGWLDYNVQKKQYITFFGNIYNKPEIFEKKWRGFQFWDPYTEEQLNSCVELVTSLCEEFFIPKNVIGHNTKIEDLSDFNGVLYKSNISKNYTDISPAWDFDNFKNKIK